MQIRRPRLINPFLDLYSAIFSAGNEEGLDVSTSKFARAKFARDFIWIALLLLPYFPNVAFRLLCQLAREMALDDDFYAQLKRGQIPHEVRRDVMDGVVVPFEALRVIADNGPLWGGTERRFKIGFAADATPLWLMLVYKLEQYMLEHEGRSILDTDIDHVSGQQIPLRELVALAAEWVADEVQTSQDEDGFAQLGWTRRNPAAHPFQILEDGADYMVDPKTGRLANANGRLYAISLQGYAYEAMLRAGQLLEQSHPERVAYYAELATKIQQDTIKFNWMEEEQYFASGWHHDVETGELARIDMIALQASTLLTTDIFKGLPDANKYIKGIMRMLYSPRLITPAGCRSKDIGCLDDLGYGDYHGPISVWGISQAIVLLGCINYGIPVLGLNLGYRHLMHLEALGNWSEGLFASPDGEIVLDFGDKKISGIRRLIANFEWQEEQMWTVALCLRLYLQYHEPQHFELWKTEDLDLLAMIDEIAAKHDLWTRPASPFEVSLLREKARPWFIDTQAGREAASYHNTGN